MLDLIKAALSMVLEGMSVPFPGIVFLLTWGNLYAPDIGITAAVSVLFAAAYSAASLFPYFIGEKLGNRAAALFGKKINEAFIKGKELMQKYGTAVIAVSRPFGWGNYISYIAGAAGIKKSKYLALTFAGIYPWCFAVTALGRKFGGDISYVLEFINSITVYIYIAVFLFTAVFIMARYKRYVKLKR